MKSSQPSGKEESPPHVRLETKKQKHPFCEWDNILWLISGFAFVYYFNVFEVVQKSALVRRRWLLLGLSLLGAALGIFSYVVGWIYRICRIPSDQWLKKYPALFQWTTTCFITGSIIIMFAVWPVWGILTPAIAVSLFMSSTILLAAIPSW